MRPVQGDSADKPVALKSCTALEIPCICPLTDSGRPASILSAVSPLAFHYFFCSGCFCQELHPHFHSISCS